jgi:exonuclease III
LDVNGLDSLIKKCRMVGWITIRPHTYCLQEMHLTDKNKLWLIVKGWKKIFQINGTQKQAGITILISDKEDANQS